MQVNWEDIEYVCVYEPYAAAPEHVLECTLYHYSHGVFRGPVEKIEDADPEFTVHVKWDGCSDLNTDGVHFCEGMDAVRMAEAIARCYRLAKRHIKHWDNDKPIPSIVGAKRG